MNRPVFDFDGGYGGDYESLARAVIPGYLSLFSQTLALFQLRLERDARILVVGAGTGIEIVTFRSAQSGWHCTGVDPSRQMLGIARQRIAAAGLQDGVELVEGYVDDLNGSSFSAATCFNVMHFLPDDGAKAQLLGGIARRLRPNAPFALFDLHGDRSTPEDAEQYEAWRAYWKLGGMSDEARRAFHQQIEEGIHWASEERILELLADAGFVDARRYFRGLLYGGWIASRP